jgi:hypothetical protein
MIKASGRVALILATGFIVALGGASQAAPTASSDTKPDGASRSSEAVKEIKPRRHHARHRTGKTAEKSSDDRADKSDKKDVAAAESTAPAASAIPPLVSNANAQLAAADTPTAAAATEMTSRANDTVQAAADQTAPTPSTDNTDNQVVASDQLNDVDRALQQDNPPAQKAVSAATDAQPRPAPVMASSSNEGSAWDQSSLIGKIFIGFGALLTLASAARMFMA